MAVSTSSAMVASSTCSAAAVALRSRTPRPPLRSADGGSAPHRSSSSSSRRTASNAAPAAAPSTCRSLRSVDASTGTSSTRSTVVCPPRSASPTSPGTTTEPVPRGTRSLRASSSSAGVDGVRGQQGVPGVLGGRLTAGGQHVLEHRPGRLGQLGQLRGDLGCRRRGHGAGPQPAHARLRTAGQALGDPAQRPQPARRLPGQGQVDQAVDRLPHPGGIGVDDLRQRRR